MDLDLGQIATLQKLWAKPELKDGVQKLILVAIGKANIGVPVTDILAVFEAMDGLMAAEEAELKPRAENI